MLADTDQFLRLKSSVQQISEQRIRDLIFLFLGDDFLDVDAFFDNDAFDCIYYTIIFRLTIINKSV